MTFSNFFNDSIGAMNVQVLPFIENFFLSWTLVSSLGRQIHAWTKIAVIMVQGWLGFPYIYILVSGILQSIPEDLYETQRLMGPQPGRNSGRLPCQ